MLGWSHLGTRRWSLEHPPGTVRSAASCPWPSHPAAEGSGGSTRGFVGQKAPCPQSHSPWAKRAADWRADEGKSPSSTRVCVCVCCCFNQRGWSSVIKGSVALIGIGLNSRSKSLLALPLPNNHQQKSNKSNWLQPLICTQQRSWW